MQRFWIRGLLGAVLLVGALTLNGYSQSSSYKGIPSLVWAKLYEISYTTATDEYGEYMVPSFSEATKKMEGETVTLPGYMIPFESGYSENHFILSSLPVNACFFCGVGGPEGVIEVYADKPIKFTDKPIEVTGKLKLNAEDPDQFMYILEDVKYLGELDF